jgi:predicted HTH transcriptional regulator
VDLRKLLEDETLELKRQLTKPDRLAAEMIAFANTRGGRLIVGYDAKRRALVGVVPDQRTEEWIANVASDHCEPRLDYEISYETVERKVLLVISVRASHATPHFLRRRGMTEGTYVRVGSTTRRSDQETLARLIRRGRNISFDSEPTSQSIRLNPSKIDEYVALRRKRLGGAVPRSRSGMLEDLRLMKRGTPTVAGALLFADEPQAESALEHAYVKAARFKGLTKGLILDQRELLGPLPEQIEEATRFVLRNTRLARSSSGTRRRDRYEYPEEIVREIIVNAVVHRDYSRSGSSVLLAVYDDRIEVTSPGGLAGPVTADNIVDRQYNRNPIIAKRMFEMGFFEGWGQGIDQIVAWSASNAAKPPRFNDEVSQFTLTVYSPDVVEPGVSVAASAPGSRHVRTALGEKVMGYLEQNLVVTNREIRKRFRVTKTQAQTVLSQLLAAGLIQRQGAGRSTHYTRTPA